MDDILISIVLILWGVFEYGRREQQHRESVTILRRTGVLPVKVVQQRAWRIVTTGLVTVVVIAFMAWLFWMGYLRDQTAYNKLYLQEAALLVPIATLLVLMVVRDTRRYIHSAQAGGRV